jgi:hypothetical protein
MNGPGDCCCWRRPQRPACSRSWSKPATLSLGLTFLSPTGSSAVRRRLLLTLLFLGAVGCSARGFCVGIRRLAWHCSTFRKQAYGYRYTEAFLSQVAHADGVERFTDVLACWTTHL